MRAWTGLSLLRLTQDWVVGIGRGECQGDRSRERLPGCPDSAHCQAAGPPCWGSFQSWQAMLAVTYELGDSSGSPAIPGLRQGRAAPWRSETFVLHQHPACGFSSSDQMLRSKLCCASLLRRHSRPFGPCMYLFILV